MCKLQTPKHFTHSFIFFPFPHAKSWSYFKSKSKYGWKTVVVKWSSSLLFLSSLLHCDPLLLRSIFTEKVYIVKWTYSTVYIYIPCKTSCWNVECFACQSYQFYPQNTYICISKGINMLLDERKKSISNIQTKHSLFIKDYFDNSNAESFTPKHIQKSRSRWENPSGLTGANSTTCDIPLVTMVLPAVMVS